MRLPLLLLFGLVMVAGVTFAFFPAASSERAETLRFTLRGADRLTVKPVEPPSESSQSAFEVRGAEKIAELVEKLDFNDAESGFLCMCLGDTDITFYRGDKQVAVLSHHHGRSVRWQKGKWQGDSLFTPQAGEGWRLWFKEQGEPRFEEMFQRDLAEAKKRAEVHTRFLAAFPPAAKPVLEEESADSWRTFSGQKEGESEAKPLSPRAQRLADLFPSRAGLALAVARSLGSLSVIDGSQGSWSSSTQREQVVLECGHSLTGDEFLALVDTNDESALVGAARLFFFEDLCEKIPAEKRGPAAARLCEAVLRGDLSGNADIAVRRMGKFPCFETTDLLERLAGGSVPFHEGDPKYKDEPTAGAAACILLAQTASTKFSECLATIQRSPNLDSFDQAALRIARSFRGEKGLLDSSIFELDSYTIGYGALKALEREGGKPAIDAVIFGGTNHSWGAVREEAILTAERMTGQKWFQGNPNERADSYGEDVRKWWEVNRLQMPD